MTDRRRLRSNGRVAHVSLRGVVQAKQYAEGVPHRVIRTRTVLLADPAGGPRDRELLLGEGFTVLDRQGDMLFGFAARDGHVGWIAASDLADSAPAPTHRVRARQSYAKATPDLKARDDEMIVSLGSRVAVSATQGAWSQIAVGARTLWVPSAHLSPLDASESDPVAVAERLLGTPYLWGGNTCLGIDCSGLVQAGCLACGLPCPGDSDQQQAELGTHLPEGASLRRGDLLFWRGHVGWLADSETLLHANAHHMAVALEPLRDAMARIEAQGDGPVTARKRL
ncbi:MAG TPA: NLP/P60 hydrolase [Rhodobacteraceae bacterium]|nr:NLP/P60 hydrolase [Paracoccaceae bacterium]